MGSGTGGKWLLLVTLYFVLLSIVATAYVSAINEVGGLDGAISVTHGYSVVSDTGINSTELEINFAGSISLWDNFTQAMGLITGFSADFNQPDIIKWIFAIILFWIPLLIFLTSIYVLVRA